MTVRSFTSEDALGEATRLLTAVAMGEAEVLDMTRQWIDEGATTKLLFLESRAMLEARRDRDENHEALAERCMLWWADRLAEIRARKEPG